MAKPNHTTGAAAIYTRLSDDLVPTYASAVYRAVLPAEALPGASDLPAVVFDMDADYADTSFADDIARMDIGVYVIRHAQSDIGEADTVVARIIGDESTHGLQRWSPTISGIGGNPLRIVSAGEGQYDTEHAAHVLRFETWYSEG